MEAIMVSGKSGIFGLLAVAFAAALAVSCGGTFDPEGVTGPSALDPIDAQAAAVLDELDGVSALGKDKVVVCHKGKDLAVSPDALQGHLRHGDTQGSCTGATCPCFSRATIEAAASGCGNLLASCPATYSLGLFCAPAGGAGAIANLGYWEAVVGQNSCSWTVWDPLSGDAVTETRPVDAAQFEACRAAITTSSPYPAFCPV